MLWSVSIEDTSCPLLPECAVVLVANLKQSCVGASSRRDQALSLAFIYFFCKCVSAILGLYDNE